MDKYAITSLLFLLTIYGIGTKTVVNNISYSPESGDATVIETINQVYDNHLAYSGELINLWSSLQKDSSMSGITLLDDVEYGSLIKDERGDLYFPATKVDVSEFVSRTSLFSASLKNRDTNYIYIQAPNKMIKGYTPKGVYSYNYSNQNADEFLKGLKRAGVDTFDLRDAIRKDHLNNSELFYKTDHHWTTQTAFWTFQKIIEIMQDKYNIPVDPEHFYTDLENYKVTQTKEVFLGSLGKRVGDAISGLDDYTFISPNFETDFSVYNGVKSLMLPIKRGNFSESIAIPSILYSVDPTTNKHASYYEMDYGYLRTVNHKIDNDLKVLIIKDSYALPVVAFLSTCIKTVDMVDLRDTPKADLETILNANQYDLVITLYNTEVFNDTMFPPELAMITF